MNAYYALDFKWRVDFNWFPYSYFKVLISHSGKEKVNSYKVPIYLSEIRQSTIHTCNTLVRWDAGTKDSSTKRLMFQALFFFIISYRLGALKTLYFWKGFCKKLWKNNNTWNIRHLVDESFVPASQQTSVLYWRLTDFYSACCSAQTAH